jgi:Family of unknown function (DUF6364)
MDQTKLTVRVSRDLLENVKRYAAQNHTTLTALIEAYLQRIPTQAPLDSAPIVRRLSGILPKDVSTKDYRDHLAKKYGR